MFGYYNRLEIIRQIVQSNVRFNILYSITIVIIIFENIGYLYRRDVRA